MKKSMKKSMKKILAFILSISIISIMPTIVQAESIAPDMEWYNYLTQTQTNPSAIKQTNDGGYIVTGNYYSTSTHQYNDSVYKLNSYGEIIWSKYISGSSYDFYNDIQQTSDGGYILSGYTYSTHIVGSPGTEDGRVVKLDSNGNVIWSKSFGGSSNDGFYRIQQTSEGGYILVGYTQSADGDVTGYHGSGDGWVVKLDANGNADWDECFGGTGYDNLYSIQQTDDGGYILAGETNSTEDLVGHNGDYDGYVIKLNNSGEETWSKCLGTAYYDSINSIEQTSDGGFILAGAYSYDADNYWIAKLNDIGNITWSKHINEGYASSIHQTINGDYIVLGSYSFDEVMIEELSSTGDIIWSKYLTGLTHDDKFINASMQLTSEGGCIVQAGYKIIKLYPDEVPTVSINYTTHVQDYGWQNYVSDDIMSGTSGQSKRLEAIKIKLTGGDAYLYDVYYRVHAQDYGWLGWAKNGEAAGTEGLSKRLEAIEVIILKKSDDASGLDVDTPFVSTYGTGSVNYRTHVQDYGWQNYVSDGTMSGTSGQSKRLEGINIRLSTNMPSGSIIYSTHVQDYGWMASVSNGTMSGTSGQSKRLEAIRINLTGEVAQQYDIYYRVHAQNVGWMGWAKNGQDAGTAGFAYRLEGIEIVLVEKGGVAPGSTANAFIEK